MTGSGLADLLSSRSAAAWMVVVWLERLLPVLVSPAKKGSLDGSATIGVVAGGSAAAKPIAACRVMVAGWVCTVVTGSLN